MSEQMIVSYTGRGGAGLAFGKLVLLAIFVALLWAYLDDDLRQILSRNNVREPVSVVGLLFLLALVAGTLIDIVLGALTTRRGQPVLVMDREGFQGRIFYRMRNFEWGALDHVYSKNGYMGLKPKKRGLFKLIDAIPSRFGPVNAANAIYFSDKAVDKSKEEIRAFIDQHARSVI